MRQIEINNEIILLRQPVRQARICVINKLIREAKKLRTHYGNDKQLEKNKNKANKLLREVFALKHIKDDEISKFAIVNSDSLQDILKNPHTNDATRAMVKIARYKSLHERILEFKEKFPDYNEYIFWRKKRQSLKRKQSSSVDNTVEKKSKRLRNDTDNIKTGVCREDDIIRANTATNTKSLQCVTRQQNKITLQRKLSEESSLDTLEGNGSNSIAAKSISKEATVKRFTEVLQEAETMEKTKKYEENNSQKLSNDAVQSTTRKDDFFLNSDEASSSVTLFCEERSKSCVSNIDHNEFKALCIINKEDGSSTDKRGKANATNEEINDKNTFHYQSNATETNVTQFKQNKIIQVKKKSIKRNIEDTTKTEDEKLHPSWAARRKQQEIMKQCFQGKKIKFDED